MAKDYSKRGKPNPDWHRVYGRLTPEEYYTLEAVVKSKRMSMIQYINNAVREQLKKDGG